MFNPRRSILKALCCSQQCKWTRRWLAHEVVSIYYVTKRWLAHEVVSIHYVTKVELWSQRRGDSRSECLFHGVSSRQGISRLAVCLGLAWMAHARRHFWSKVQVCPRWEEWTSSNLVHLLWVPRMLGERLGTFCWKRTPFPSVLVHFVLKTLPLSLSFSPKLPPHPPRLACNYCW